MEGAIEKFGVALVFSASGGQNSNCLCEINHQPLRVTHLLVLFPFSSCRFMYFLFIHHELKKMSFKTFFGLNRVGVVLELILCMYIIRKKKQSSTGGFVADLVCFKCFYALHILVQSVFYCMLVFSFFIQFIFLLLLLSLLISIGTNIAC